MPSPINFAIDVYFNLFESFFKHVFPTRTSLVAQTVKNLPTMQETMVLFLGREDPLEEGNGNPLQYSCLENSVDRGAWQATVQGFSKNQT